MQDERDIFGLMIKGMSPPSKQNDPNIFEKKLQIERAYAEQLFESAQEAIVLADKKGNIIRNL